MVSTGAAIVLLTSPDDQVDFFMKNGYIRLTNVFTETAAKEWSKDVWRRLGMDPDDQSTWGDKERINMPSKC